MQAKDFALDVKEVSDAGTFEGYGSVFGGTPDSYGDIVAPGAFAESLVRHRREGSMPLMLFGHKSNELPIGNWIDMAEDGKGLWVKGQIYIDDSVGERVHRALKKKAMRGLSIGYVVKGSTRDDKKPGITTLTELELWEVSVVNFPANRRSMVTSVKATQDLRDRIAAGDRLSVRELERVLKDHLDLSNSEAERAVRIHLKNGQGAPDITVAAGSDFLRALLKA